MPLATPPPQVQKEEEEAAEAETGQGATAATSDRKDASEPTGSQAPTQRLPPPPRPPSPGSDDGRDDDSDWDEPPQVDAEDQDDLLQQAKRGDIHAQPSKVDVEEGISPENTQATSPTSPVAFEPVHSPAQELDSKKLGHVSPPHPASGNALSNLGLPRDEVELKHETEVAEHEQQAHTQDEDDDDDGDEPGPAPPPRTERPAGKPMGPRPMPGSPSTHQQIANEGPSGDDERPTAAEPGVASPIQPPKRQHTVGDAAQVGVPLPRDADEVGHEKTAESVGELVILIPGQGRCF